MFVIRLALLMLLASVARAEAGTNLRIVPAGTSKPLNAVWGSGPSDVWMAGDAGTLLHWNGQKISAVATHVDANLRSVTGNGSDDVWVAGDRGTLLHWDGSTWSRAESPGKLTDFNWVSISENNSGEVWIAGEHYGQAVDLRIFRWNGEGWDYMRGTSCRGECGGSVIWSSWPKDAYYRSGSTGAHWNEKHWDESGGFGSIAGTSRKDVYFGGGDQIHHMGGSPEWIKMTDSLKSYRLAVASAKDIWVVNAGGDGLGHWNGAKWQNLGNPAHTRLEAIWVSSEGYVWAVGQSGKIVTNEPGNGVAPTSNPSAPPMAYEDEPAPAPVATVAVAMSDNDFQALVQAIQAEAFPQQKVGVVETAAGNNSFTVAQVAAMVDLMAFPNDKVHVVELTAKHIVDPKNGAQLLAHFVFPNDKDTVRGLLSHAR